MTDWSRGMAKKLRDRIENQKLNDAKFVATQELKREIGPSLWGEILNHISIEGNALNEEMGQDVVTASKPSPSGEMELVANLPYGVKRCHVRFEAELGKLTWKNDNGAGDSRELAVGVDGKMAFHFGMVPSTPGSIAKQILGNLLD